MRQTVLINGSHPDYLVNLRGSLIKALVKRGYDVHVTSPDIDQTTMSKLNQMGATAHEVELQRRSFNLRGDFRYFLYMRKIIRNIRPVFVLGYTVKPNIWGSIAAAASGAPSASMVTGMGYAFINSKGRRRRLAQIAIQRLYALATRFNRVVIFQNEDDLRDFVQLGCLSNPSKGKLVNGSGVDVDFFSNRPLPNEPNFLLIARLLKSKGVRDYVEAGKRLLRTHPEVRIRLAGFLDKGPDAITRAELDEWAAEGVEFLGKLEDVRPAIADASVYVLPSYREGTPRTVLEAMALGRPIITTDTAGCRETTIQDVNGYLVPVQDVERLYEAMRALAEDPHLRQDMGMQSRRIAVEKYAVDAVNETLLTHLAL